MCYTDAKKQNFEGRLPAHIEDTAVNHYLWLHFCYNYSQVEVGVEARRMAFFSVQALHDVARKTRAAAVQYCG